MKRELKFRAWDKDMREMVFVSAIQFDPHSPKEKPNIIDERNDIRDLDEVELMQFTGLFDKNGKEIYEGDIIKTETDKLMAITWSQKFASFCLNRDGWAFQHWFGEACNPKNCEVIGNIYENESLLK